MKKELQDWIHDLDELIRLPVVVLVANGIETYASCQGGKEHPYYEPTVRFHGGQWEGFKAMSFLGEYGLPVRRLARIWVIDYDLPRDYGWEVTFWNNKGSLLEAISNKDLLKYIKYCSVEAKEKLLKVKDD